MTTMMTFILGEEPPEPVFGRLEPRRLATRREVEDELAGLSVQVSARWIAHADQVHWLIRAFSRLTRGKRRRDQLLVLEPLDAPEQVSLAHALFSRVVPGFNLLPPDQMAEVLGLENRDEYCIGGSVDRETETVTLFRGDLSTVVVPFSFFEPSSVAVAPDFARFSVSDSGQTLAFGEYEASMDAVLYELDTDYRRRVKAQRLTEDRSFGASLRRLRKQRKIRRSDFAPVSAKTIARIERGEVDRPHRGTLEQIAHVLDVDVEELAEY